VIYDISQTLRASLPVWPGDGAFECGVTAEVAAGSSVTLHRFAMSSQSGTHAESARHVRDDSASLDELELGVFWGLCTVVDVSAGVGPVLASEVLPKLSAFASVSASLERVLLRTFAKPNWSTWPADFRPIASGLIDEIAARGGRLIGTDAPSIDPASSKTLEAHHAAHRARMAILEGLVLDQIPEGVYELVALPLPIKAVEATPVRAVLRTLDESQRHGSIFDAREL
jgi:arylformamidase